MQIVLGAVIAVFRNLSQYFRQRPQLLRSHNLRPARKDLNDLKRLAPLALRHQCAHHAQSGSGVARLCLYDHAQLLFRVRPMAGGQQAVCFRQCVVGFVWRHLLQKLAHAWFGNGAHKAVDHLPVAESLHCRNALHPKTHGEVGVLVHIYLCKKESAVTFCCQLLQHRAKRAAWAAPRRPKVHQYRRLIRAVDDINIEGALAHVKYKIRRSHWFCLYIVALCPVPL